MRNFIFLPTLLTKAVLNKAPPLHLPLGQTFQTNLCQGNIIQNPDPVTGNPSQQTQTTPNGLLYPFKPDLTPGLAILFLDGSDEFSRRQYKAFAHLSSHYNEKEIKFIGIESYSLQSSESMSASSGTGTDMTSWEVCEATHQPRNSPAQFLLDRHDFFNNQYAFEYFGVSPNELVLYHQGQRFRYLPKIQADLTRPISHSWVKTALDELYYAISDASYVNPGYYTQGTQGNNYMSPGPQQVQNSQSALVSSSSQDPDSLSTPLYLTNSYDKYPGFTLPTEGEVGRIMQASGEERCVEHCKEIGCTSFILYGTHHCSFFASEPWAIRHLKTRYSDAQLFIRKPLHDVNATSKILSGFLLASLIVLMATACFMICNKSVSRKSVGEMSYTKWGMDNITEMSSSDSINLPMSMTNSDYVTTEHLDNMKKQTSEYLNQAGSVISDKINEISGMIQCQNGTVSQNDNLVDDNDDIEMSEKIAVTGGIISPKMSSVMNELGEKLVEAQEEPAE